MRLGLTPALVLGLALAAARGQGTTPGPTPGTSGQFLAAGSAQPAPAASEVPTVVQLLSKFQAAPGTPVNCTFTEVDSSGSPTVVACDGGLTFYSSAPVELSPVEPEGSAAWWDDLLFAGVCVCFAALAAGLTLGLSSMDEFALKVLCNRSIDDIEPACKDCDTREQAQARLLQDQRAASRILPLISGHFFNCGSYSRFNPSNSHCLLVTLLLTNAAANEALPLFLGRIVPEWLAVVLSVTVVLLFGEIAPSAIFTGPNQLRLASALTPLVRGLRIVLLPVVLPISLLLDTLLGHEEEDHDRSEMKAIARTLKHAGLEGDEVSMIHGVLEMHARTAKEISRPLSAAKMLAHDDVISQETVSKLMQWGHSRIFVYRRDPEDPARRDDIIAVLLAKRLLGVNWGQGIRVDQCVRALKQPVVLSPTDNLLSTLNKFQEGMCHLAVLSEQPGELEEAVIGGVPAPAGARPAAFCSLEDVIESVLKEEIFDEADVELGRAPGSALKRARSVLSSLSRSNTWTCSGCAGCAPAGAQRNPTIAMLWPSRASAPLAVATKRSHTSGNLGHCGKAGADFEERASTASTSVSSGTV